MHKLQNGSQVSVRPQRKPLVGLGGYFSESNDQGAPSYPGQDWFNDCTDEFINALDEMGITYDQEQLDHLARAFAAVRSQEWNANANYGIGQEVVRNGLRYIARAASGPDNGGAVEPSVSSVQSSWGVDLISGHLSRQALSTYVKIAEVDGVSSSNGDHAFLEVYGGSPHFRADIFSCDIMFTEHQGGAKAVIHAKTLATSGNPTFYTKQKSSNVYELWLKIETSAPTALTVIQKSATSRPSSVIGILDNTNTAPTGITLVPYDTGYQFDSIPIGMEVAFDTPPPTNDPRFRFVKLTADDAYNGSLLNNKVISGTAPNLVVKMTVNSALSPINGQQIFMLNTMESTRRPGVNGDNIVNDASRKITAAVEIGYNSRETFSNISGAFKQDTNQTYASNPPSALTGPTRLIFDSSLVVPTAPRNEVFAITEVRYKRIY